MAKFYGPVGYVDTVEVRPGVWEEQITVRNYRGDLLENTVKWASSSDSTNDDLNISNQISIVADPFAYQNAHLLKYVEYMGAKWKIISFKISRPRLILTVGGLYNGAQA
jgi:hypothetical protein